MTLRSAPRLATNRSSRSLIASPQERGRHYLEIAARRFAGHEAGDRLIQHLVAFVVQQLEPALVDFDQPYPFVHRMQRHRGLLIEEAKSLLGIRHACLRLRSGRASITGIL